MLERFSSVQMAHFAAHGLLRFDGRVPADINEQFLDEAGRLKTPAPGQDGRAVQSVMAHNRALLRANQIPEVPAGTPLLEAYKEDTALGRLVRLPWVQGGIESLVGHGCLIDHHFLHITFPPSMRGGTYGASQNTHQDSTIDPRQAFDIQLMYFPHEVTPAMGGTRYVPGTHLRVVSEAAIGRYQNMLGQERVVCPAGTLIFTHHASGTAAASTARIAPATCSRFASTPPCASAACGIHPISAPRTSSSAPSSTLSNGARPSTSTPS